jgi:hypothetical protein
MNFNHFMESVISILFLQQFILQSHNIMIVTEIAIEVQDFM